MLIQTWENILGNELPVWLRDRVRGEPGHRLAVRTPEGTKIADPGDVIVSAAGRIYPVKAGLRP